MTYGYTARTDVTETSVRGTATDARRERTSMSLGREMAEEWRIDAELLLYQALRKAEAGIWTQKDGTLIAVEDMETRHIQNCIRMLERQNERYGADGLREVWIEVFDKELRRRHE